MKGANLFEQSIAKASTLLSMGMSAILVGRIVAAFFALACFMRKLHKPYRDLATRSGASKTLRSLLDAYASVPSLANATLQGHSKGFDQRFPSTVESNDGILTIRRLNHYSTNSPSISRLHYNPCPSMSRGCGPLLGYA